MHGVVNPTRGRSRPPTTACTSFGEGGGEILTDVVGEKEMSRDGHVMAATRGGIARRGANELRHVGRIASDSYKKACTGWWATFDLEFLTAAGYSSKECGRRLACPAAQDRCRSGIHRSWILHAVGSRAWNSGWSPEGMTELPLVSKVSSRQNPALHPAGVMANSRSAVRQGSEDGELNSEPRRLGTIVEQEIFQSLNLAAVSAQGQGTPCPLAGLTQ
ncbi:hypothetical protein R1flu_013431 [Riccia fluitans]|uniref:Uncharacterized protein n=1 Tax=Riccia fluitans TaxID=41844 RepID=A0ABD1YDI3_9MARC